LKQQKVQEGQKTLTKTQERSNSSARSYDFLEPVEEKVLRMHYGLSENDDKALEYAVGASEDAKLRVGLMEANNVAYLEGNCPLTEGADKEVLLTVISKV
jgi:hypothetical protein